MTNRRVTRRDVLRQMSAVVAATALPARDATGASLQSADAVQPSRFFPGFKPLTLQVTRRHDQRRDGRAGAAGAAAARRPAVA